MANRNARLLLLLSLVSVSVLAAGCGGESDSPRYVNDQAGCIFQQGFVLAGVAPRDEVVRMDHSSAGEFRAWDDRGTALVCKAGIGDSKLGPQLGMRVEILDESKTAECQGEVVFNGRSHRVQATWIREGPTWWTTSCQVDGKNVAGAYHRLKSDASSSAATSR
jgi:hypothetical protein